MSKKKFEPFYLEDRGPQFSPGPEEQERTSWDSYQNMALTEKKVIVGREGGRSMFIDPNKGIGAGAVNLTTGRPPFFVDLDGNLYATSATINGALLGTGAWIFGDGYHETVTVTAGNTTTLTTDTYADIVAVAAGATVYCSNYRLYAATSLTNAGAIINDGKPGGDGADGPGQTGGTGAGTIAVGTYAVTIPGEDGATNNGLGNVNGTDGDAATGWGVAGVAGGTAGGGGGTGGAAGAITSPPFTPHSWLSAFTHFNYAAGTVINSSAGSGSGGTRGQVNDGPGGGSGAPGGICFIAAKTITNTGTISAKGGAGGVGGDATAASARHGGGGGGAGSGGVMLLVYKTLTNTGTISVAGGTGGAGGAGDGVGQSGAAGSNGNTGNIYYITVE